MGWGILEHFAHRVVKELRSHMKTRRQNAEFPEQADENRRIWEANALWWDDRIGDGNDFQTVLIEPATERLLEVAAGDTILDVACGAGRFARRMAELGASVVAFDYSAEFIARARQRTPSDVRVEYHIVDAANVEAVLSLGPNRFNKAVCTMAIMDMPEIGPLFATLSRVLTPGAAFVFSVTHPCFHSAAIQRFAEIYEEEAGQHVIRSGVKVSSYLSPSARKTEGIVGQPEPQWFFHRSISTLFRFGFEAGFIVDGIEEPRFTEDKPRAGVRWHDMPDIPPIMVVRMRLIRGETVTESAYRVGS
jgi:2-polyprenyl-3-methyl-5-hydroxy-6-metoxy-1,4-benzoquinol methylase